MRTKEGPVSGGNGPLNVVRMLLAPAVLTWLGDRAWSLPRWIDRLLPRLELEGREPQPQSA